MKGKVRFATADYNESIGLFQYKPFWRNFIHEISHDYRTRNQILAEYNARHVDSDPKQQRVGTGVIEFDSEEDAIMFMLRWS